MGTSWSAPARRSVTRIWHLTLGGSAADLVFNLPTGDGNNNAVLGDDGLGNGISRLSGTGFETTDFANPSSSLTVNLGNDGETFTLALLDPAFAATTIDLNSGSGNDVFNVQATPASAITLLDEGSGANVINVSSNAPTNTGNLNDLDGILRMNTTSAAGTRTLNISESGLATADSVTIDLAPAVGFISGTAGGGWRIEEVNFASNAVNLSLGSAGDQVNVLSLTQNETANVSTNGGADTVNVGSAANSLDSIGAVLSVNAGGQAGDVLNVNDQGDGTVNTYTVSATQVTRSVGPTISYSGLGSGTLNLNGGTADDTYNVTGTAAGTTNVNAGGGNDTINVNGGSVASALTLNGQNGNDTFNVSPSVSAVINIDGGAPVFPTFPGDTINYVGAGTITPAGTGGGTIAAPCVQDVIFQSIERLTGGPFDIVTPGSIDIFNNTTDPTVVTIATNGSQISVDSASLNTLTPGNGIVNVLGDNNNPATPQADTFIIVGDGSRRFDLNINGSAPIQFLGVDSLNVNGGQLDDTTAITPFATSVAPWNIVTTVDGGADGANGDRLIYTNVANLFDDDHLVATGTGAGRIDALGIGSTSTNQVVRFLGTEKVTLIANPGDGDAATIDLTNGSDTATFLFDPSNPVTPPITTLPGSLPIAAVANDITLLNHFNVVLDSVNNTGLTVNGQAGADSFVLDLVGAAGTLPIPVSVNGGSEADTITIIGNAGNDQFNNIPGADPGAGTVSIAGTDTGAISYTGIESLAYDGAGAGADTAFLAGTAGADSITLVETNGAAAGTVTASSQPAISFGNLGGGSNVSVNTFGGDDLFTVQQAVNWGIVTVNTDLGAATTSDTFDVVGTGNDDVFTFNPGNRKLIVSPAGGVPVVYNNIDVEIFNLDGAANTTASPGDTLNVLSAMSGPALPPSGTLTSSGLTVNYQNFETVLVGIRPTATDDTAAVSEDNSIIIDVLGNDTISNAPGSIQLITLPTNGTVVVLAANDPANPPPTFGVRPVVRYSPNLNFFGADTFTYRVVDANSQTSPTDATVSITVNAVNDVPTFTLQNVPVTVAEDSGAQSVVVATNITPGGPSNPLEAGQVLTFNIVGNTNSALFSVQPTIAANGALTFTPAANANGSATIIFNLSDDGGTANGGVDTSANQAFAIVVTAVNDAPTVTAPPTATTNEDTPLTVSGISIDDAADGNVGNFTVTLIVTDGTLSRTGSTGNGTSNLTFTGTQAQVNAALATVVYTPAPDFNSTAVLTTTVNDNGNVGSGGALTATATTTITVAAVNDAPVNTLPAQTGTEDTTTAITGLSVADVDAGAGDVTVTLSVTHGVLNGAVFTPASGATIAITGTLAAVNAALAAVTYTPNPNFNGADTLTMVTSDNGNTGLGGALTDSDTTTITVTAVNDAPVNTLPPQTGTEDTTTAITGVSVTDVDAGTGNVTVTLSVTDGTLGGTGFTPASGATISITGTLTAVNTALATVTYTPSLNFNGVATLTMVTSDNGNTGSGGPLSDTDTTTITVAAVNDPPVANPDSYTTAEDTPLTVAAPGVLGNDTDVDGPAATAVLVSDVTNGTLTLNPDGSFTYTPNADFNGTDSFTYQVDDTAAANNLSNVVTVTITVTAVNDAPVNTLPAGPVSIPENTPTVIAGISVSDIDAGGADIRVSLSVLNGTLAIQPTIGVVPTGNGTASVTLTGPQSSINAALATLQYTSNLNYNGPDTLTVVTNDLGNTGSGGPLEDTDTLAIDVTAVNDPPVNTVSGPQTTLEDTPVSIPGLSIADIDLGAGTITVTFSVLNGTLGGTGFNNSGTASIDITDTLVAVNAALATVTYTPNANFSGSDTLTMVSNDNGNTGTPGALTDTDTVAITVTAVADAPTLTVTSPATGTENVAISLTIAAALVDTDGSETLSIEIIGVPPNATFNQGTNLGSGAWRFTPAELTGLTITVPDGPANFNLTVNAIVTEQANGDTETTTQVLNVDVANTAPTANMINSGPVFEGSPGSVTVINQADPSLADVLAGFRYSFDFNNDGDFSDVGETGGTYASSTTNPTAAVPGVYLDDGPGAVTVRARVFDKDDGFVDVFTTITVNNVAPAATFSAQGPFIERQPITVIFSNQFDPSSADTAAGFTYSYDLDGDGVFEIMNSTSPTAVFTPPTEGVFTVHGRIYDKDGGFTEYTAGGAGGLVIRNVDIFATGTGISGGPLVNVYNPYGSVKGSFFPYDPDFRGGVTLAVGDLTGDGIPDIVTGTGPGGGPDIRVFDGVTFRNIASFLAYEQSFRGGVYVAVGDVDGDGNLDIVTGTGDGGGPIIGVFAADGTLKHRFSAFDPDFRGGVNVASGDVNGDSKADIIAGAGDGGAPRVQVFSGADPRTILSSFFAYESTFRGGVFVSAGDVDGDGQVEIVTGTGRGGGPRLQIFDSSGVSERSVFIFGPDRTSGQPLRNGFYVSA